MTRLSHLLLLLPLAAAQDWWRPAPRSTWDIQLHTSNATIARNPASILDLDLFDNPASTIASIHAAGKRAICYFSAGTYENWRSDNDSFTPDDYANPLPDWDGEYWLRTNRDEVREIMRARLDTAVEIGCDAVDPDNIDAYDNDNGAGLTREDAIDYVKFLAAEGHARGLAVGLKNGVDIVEDVLDDVDFEVNEQCVEYEECADLALVVEAGKPVFGIEYYRKVGEELTPVEDLTEAQKVEICAGGAVPGSTEGHSTVLKRMDLDWWIWACPV